MRCGGEAGEELRVPEVTAGGLEGQLCHQWRAPEAETELKKDQAWLWVRCPCDIPSEMEMCVQGSGERSRLEMKASASSATPTHEVEQSHERNAPAVCLGG